MKAVKGLAWGILGFFPPLCMAQPVSSDLDLSGDDVVPVVITPTRLRQSLADVPASVTVITSDTLQKLRISSVVDALRLVPGMDITEPSGNDDRINYHGTGVLGPRRINVLIDGISVYRPAFSRVSWGQLPVVIEDIDRIEVTRGPNSAAYGPNSMTAIINIITKHPRDVGRGLGSIRVTDRGHRELTARVGTEFGDSAVRVTAGQEEDHGYDHLVRINQDHDSTRLKRLNVRSDTRISGTQGLGLQFALVEGVAQVPFADANQASFPDQKVHDLYFSGTYTERLSAQHEWQVHLNHADYSIRQPWVTCLPTGLLLPQLYELWRVSPADVNALLAGRLPVGASAAENALIASAAAAIRNLGARARQPTCVNANQDLFEKRTDLELTDTQALSDKVRLVSGIGARHHVARSETFFAGSLDNDAIRAFANVEYRPRNWVTLNAGGYAERDALTGATFSPRVAANFQVADGQTVRFVFSQGTRTPDIYEQRANWTYSFSDVSPAINGLTTARFYRSAVSPGNLQSERITSREVGYLLNVKSMGLLLDVKVFEDRLTDLISEKLQVASFSPTNANSVRLRGLEWQSQLNFNPSWSAWFNYAYLQNFDATTVLERTQYARHSGALALNHQLSELWNWSAAYYAASGNGLGQSQYGRQDFSVTRRSQGPQRWTATLGLSRLDNINPTYFQDFGSVLESKYNSRLSLFGQLQFTY